MQAEQTPYRVYVDGIWDLFHQGHGNFFSQAIEKATQFAGGREVKLIVGVCGQGVEEYKRKTIMDLDERCKAVKAHKLVYEVICDCPMIISKNHLSQYNIHLVIHGDDFDEDKKHYYYGDAIKQKKFATVPYTQGVSTTELIRQAKEQGKFNNSLKSTLIEESELIQRIKERSWKELGKKKGLA